MAATMDRSTCNSLDPHFIMVVAKIGDLVSFSSGEGLESQRHQTHNGERHCDSGG
jgi:hypothetical protein